MRCCRATKAKPLPSSARRLVGSRSAIAPGRIRAVCRCWAILGFKQHRITDKFSRWWFVGGELVMSLFAHGASVLAGQQTLVVQRADLSHQCPRTPILFGSFPHIPSPRLRVIQAQECTVVGPTQFVTQCVTIREGAIEKPHVPQIRRVEASPKFGSQPLRQPEQEFCAVVVFPSLVESRISRLNLSLICIEILP